MNSPDELQTSLDEGLRACTSTESGPSPSSSPVSDQPRSTRRPWGKWRLHVASRTSTSTVSVRTQERTSVFLVWTTATTLHDPMVITVAIGTASVQTGYHSSAIAAATSTPPTQCSIELGFTQGQLCSDRFVDSLGRKHDQIKTPLAWFGPVASMDTECPKAVLGNILQYF